MSWGEIKKAINSDLNEPLNYLNYIDNVVTVGNDGYVINTESVVNELGSKSKLALNDKIAYPLINNAIFNYNTGVGRYFGNLTDNPAAFDGLSSIEDVAGDVDAMTAVANSETAMTAVANSETAMTAVANSETAMTVIINSETACDAIRNSSIAITALDNSSPVTVPTMTSNTSPSGIVSASSFISAGYEAYRAFDKVNASYWVSNTNTNSWLKYQFVSDVWCYKVVIKAIVDNQSIKNCKIQYSSDGTDWTDGQAILVSNANTNEQEFTVAKPSGKVKHWRLFCIDNYGHTNIAVDEVNFYCK